MTEFDFLLNNFDILEVLSKQYDSVYSLIITFKWEVDCGCFSYYKESILTVYFPSVLKEKIINDLKNGTGKIFQYVLNHKEYTGELLDLRSGYYD